jgi:hypothetical protein
LNILNNYLTETLRRALNLRQQTGGAVMEYRGIEYTVVQTANPTGWKWTVNTDAKHTKTGTGFSRVGAIRRAEKVIEDHVKGQARNLAAEQRRQQTA